MTQEQKQILKEYDEQQVRLEWQLKELVERRKRFISANQLNNEPTDYELDRLRSALDKIQAIADGYVSAGELPVMVVVQTICKLALAGGSDE